MKAKEVFTEHSIKSTKARINIYNIMSENNEGLKAEDIYNICRDKGVDINLSTVYRTLEIFEENNIVEKYDTGENSYKYFFKVFFIHFSFSIFLLILKNPIYYLTNYYINLLQIFSIKACITYSLYKRHLKLPKAPYQQFLNC